MVFPSYWTMEKIWQFYPQAPKNFLKRFSDYPPLVLQLLYNRGLKKKKEIESFFSVDYEKDLHSPFLLSGMKKATARLKRAKKNKEKVAIFGDYDVDGICAATILNDTLRKLEIFPLVYIPDRKKEGYGLNLKAIKKLKKSGVSLIITVDCGINDYKEIVLANNLGIDIIITDHHLPSAKLPPAYTIINPHKKKDPYPNKYLSGAGVAFKLACALIESFREDFKAGEEKWLLDLVAIATIADLMPLRGENRTLVKYGFLVIAKTKRLGIKALFKTARIPLPKVKQRKDKKIKFKIKNLNAHTIGFIIGPRLNAAGRMKHANIAFLLLNAKSQREAEILAQKLDRENRRRQKLQEEITKKIKNNLKEEELKKEKIVIAGHRDWPIGLVGLVAGNICDQYYVPTFIFKKGRKESRGSCRGIPEMNVVKVLESCSQFLEEYGGHKAAGGFSFATKNLLKLNRCLKKQVKAFLGKKELFPKILIESEIGPEELNLELEKILEEFSPFGEGNPPPIFLLRKALVADKRKVGRNGKHLRLKLRIKRNDYYKYLTAIIFEGKSSSQAPEIEEGKSYDFIFSPLFDEWQGLKRLTLKIIDYKTA